MLIIQTAYELKKRSEVQNIFFHCKYDKCNSKEIFNQMSELVDDYYDMAPIRNILGYETKTTGKGNTTSSYQKTTGKESTTSSYRQTTGKENTTSSFHQTTAKPSSTATMTDINSTTMKNSGLQIYCSNTVMHGALIVFIFETISFL
jgi:hypothetical protein